MTDFAKSPAWRKFEKLPRPLLRWLSLLGSAWVFGLCDIAGFPMDSLNRAAILGFTLSVYGIRAVEHIK